MTIETLAQEARVTVRTVRNYQTKGLLPGPTLKGRKGLYGPEHLARLRLIREMQEAGFNLTAIKKLLDRVPEGAGEEVLRFERSLLSSWSDEEPEVMSVDELTERFGNPSPEVLERAVAQGLVRLLGDGRVEIASPTLLRAGQQVMELGIPLEDILEVTDQLVTAGNRVAAAFIDLFLRNVWQPFEEAGRPTEQWPEVRAALERLRPLASEALLGAFQTRMTRAVEDAFGSVIDESEEDRPAV